jgi:hypothetical protein
MLLFIHFAFDVSTKRLLSRLHRIMQYLIAIKVWILVYHKFVFLIHLKFTYIWDTRYLVLYGKA